MPTCGRAGKDPGKMVNGKDRKAVYSNLPMLATPGRNSPKDCQPLSKVWGVSVLAFLNQIQKSSMLLLMPIRDSAASIAAMMLERVGRRSATMPAPGDEVRTSLK